MPKALYISASAIETADINHGGCLRKWWFKHVAKLPELPKESTTFGDVLHSVAERFLKADENGCVDNKPVELYPEGWECPVNRWTGLPAKEGISLKEQALVKSLISKAISEGILMRVPGRKIEEPIRNWKIMDGFLLNGFIDLLEPGAIRDHKTTKDMKWAKSVKKDSSNALSKSVQMMLYGYWYYEKAGWPKDMPVALSHQYYVKNENKLHVEKRELSVTWPEVKGFFEQDIQPIMELMAVYRDETDFAKIPLPENTEEACRKFGGCPFATICTEQEAPIVYTRRIEKALTGINNQNYENVANGLKGESNMAEETALQKKVREMREKKMQQQEAPAKTEETKAPEQKPEAEQKQEVETQVAPWYFKGCKACSDNPIKGLNSSMVACRICDAMQNAQQKKTSTDYKWHVDEKGHLIVDDPETGKQVLDVKVAEEPTAKEVVAAPEAALTEAEQRAMEEPPIPEKTSLDVPPETTTETEQPPARKEINCHVPPPEIPIPETDKDGNIVVFDSGNYTHERDKFRLVIHAVVTEAKVKGGGKFGSPSFRVTAEELLITVEQEMEKIVGVKKWSEYNGFQRKEAVQLYAKAIADMLGTSTVIAAHIPRGTLLEALVSAIRPYAGEVIQGVQL